MPSTGYSEIFEVRLATTAALPAHTRTGSVLTASSNGALPSQDGNTLGANELLLVKDEGAGNHLENGIYEQTQVGNGSQPWKLTRCSWFDTGAGIRTGVMVLVTDGSRNKKHWFAL